jgi:large subunit ribosomal protein L6
MNVSIKGQTLEVKNFIGEVVPRSYSFSKDVDVKLNGEMISVTGINKELVSQTAGSIEQLTRRVGFDRRIFQDGIYIVDKDGKLML